MNIKKYFHRKKIVHTSRFEPAMLLKTVTYKKKRFVRIGFTNRQKIAGMMPITDVPFEDVLKIRVLPSRFQKFIYGIFGSKPKDKWYIINHSKNKNHVKKHDHNIRSIGKR